jgi:Met-zincin/Domain of unknown function (DUF5117)
MKTTRYMKTMGYSALLLAVVLSSTSVSLAKPPKTAQDALPSIAEKTASMKSMPGLLPLYWDAATGKLYLEIPALGVDLLYVDSLPFGTGSNDLGLDRGQVSDAQIVRFERFGPKILLIEPNEKFRSGAADAAQRVAVRQSFPESVLAGFTVIAEDGAGAAKGGALLVDATEFFERDAHHISEALSQSHQDDYKLDAARSAITLEGTRAFPKNIEVEAMLTFTSEAPAKSKFVADVTPDPHALTLRIHQSFIELPGPGFVPRRYDPRSGYFDLTYRDYTTPLGEPLDQKLIVRHRLVKKDPNCQSGCVAQQPIQYYVDRGAPEPILKALVEGASWWDEAFQAAGWAPGTFKVDVMPEGADPMDVRYNVIQWVHRYTRGWSYGQPVADPRTGEIIKGNVTLGSLRGRQDYLIAEALLSPYVTGRKFTPQEDPMQAMVLARLRQLSAHETGHTLGLAHNFAASAFPHSPSQTVSVMDYPHPWITLDANGAPEVSQAYGVGIGQWDKVSIDYGYRQFVGSADEAAELGKILSDSEKVGLVFISDDDARPLGSAHPHAHLWDNGGDPAEELERILTIRSAALSRFGENAIRPGVPMSQLEDTLVPLYLLHRYQTEAAIKEIGGLDYRYQLRGDGQMNPAVVSPSDQRKALKAVLKTLSPEFLTLPERLLRLFPPRPPAFDRSRESFPSDSGLTFDPVATAECAADLTLAGLFNVQRAARLVEYHARNPQNPTLLGEVIEATLAATRPARLDAEAGADALTGVVQRAVYARAVEALLSLAANPQASFEVHAIAYAKLDQIRQQTPSNSATALYLRHRIEQFQKEPEKFAPAPPVGAPPGMPIGDEEE